MSLADFIERQPDPLREDNERDAGRHPTADSEVSPRRPCTPGLGARSVGAPLPSPLKVLTAGESKSLG